MKSNLLHVVGQTIPFIWAMEVSLGLRNQQVIATAYSVLPWRRWLIDIIMTQETRWY